MALMTAIIWSSLEGMGGAPGAFMPLPVTCARNAKLSSIYLLKYGGQRQKLTPLALFLLPLSADPFSSSKY